ncbi:MAG: hypothetical protein ACXIU8_14360 [Alkalilacustris sp.]
MTRIPPPPKAPKAPPGSDRTPAQAPASAREDRLKSALKANIARRKAQARARAVDDGGTPQSMGD